MMSICRQWVTVNGLITKVVSIGENIAAKPKKIILVFPGNPGLASFYEDFIEALYHQNNGKISVWAVGHFGHDVTGHEKLIPSRSKNMHLFNLTGQIQHKIDFVDEHVPKDCKITLVGHSIGAKMVLEVMKHFQKIESRKNLITTGCLLFPTIEWMYRTPSGFPCWIQTAYLAPLLVAIAWLLQTILPRSVIQRIVRAIMGNRERPLSQSIENAIVDLVNPISAGNGLYMAYTELLEVCELDQETILLLNDKLRFYYGSSDHWCPTEFYDGLVLKIPMVQAVMCQRKIPHAFVLGYSKETAEEVQKWIE